MGTVFPSSDRKNVFHAGKKEEKEGKSGNPGKDGNRSCRMRRDPLHRHGYEEKGSVLLEEERRASPRHTRKLKEKLEPRSWWGKKRKRSLWRSPIGGGNGSTQPEQEGEHEEKNGVQLPPKEKKKRDYRRRNVEGRGKSVRVGAGKGGRMRRGEKNTTRKTPKDDHLWSLEKGVLGKRYRGTRIFKDTTYFLFAEKDAEDKKKR